MSPHHRFLVAGIGCSLFWAGCAGVPAAQVVQTAGTIVGSAIAPGIGAPLGSLVGLLAGMLVQGQVDQATETRERQELGSQMDVGQPASGSAAPPQGEPTRVWVDEAVQGGRLITGHFDTRYIP